MLVDFFIAGVQKGATTALYYYLRRHPAVDMARTKELHHFDDDGMDWHAPDHARLHAAFDWDLPARLRGEATPIYTYWPNALERLQRYNPEARLIVVLRHPSFRAYSHWRMETTRNVETRSFARAVGSLGRLRVRLAAGGVHRAFSYVERGFYADQVERLLRLFPRRQVLFLRTDQLWSNAGEVLVTVEHFLGLPPGIAAEQSYVVPLPSKELGQMSSWVRRSLDRRFRTDICRTARLTGLNLADWLDPHYQEPMGRSRAEGFSGKILEIPAHTPQPP